MNPVADLRFTDPMEGELYRVAHGLLSARYATRVGAEPPVVQDGRVDCVWGARTVGEVDPFGFPPASPGVSWCRLRAHAEGAFPGARGVRLDALFCPTEAPVWARFHLGHFEVHPSIPWPVMWAEFFEPPPRRRVTRIGMSYAFPIADAPTARRFTVAGVSGASPLALRADPGFREAFAALSESPEALLATVRARYGAARDLALSAIAGSGVVSGAFPPEPPRPGTPAEIAAAHAEVGAWHDGAVSLAEERSQDMHWYLSEKLPREALVPPQSFFERLRARFTGSRPRSAAPRWDVQG